MNHKKLQAMAEELATDIKTPEDLSQLSSFLTKLTVEAVLKGEMSTTWVTTKTSLQAITRAIAVMVTPLKSLKVIMGNLIFNRLVTVTQPLSPS